MATPLRIGNTYDNSEKSACQSGSFIRRRSDAKCSAGGNVSKAKHKKIGCGRHQPEGGTGIGQRAEVSMRVLLSGGLVVGDKCKKKRRPV
jgi:hypothetical protein